MYSVQYTSNSPQKSNVLRLFTMDQDKLPFYFENLSASDDELVKSNFGEAGYVRDLGWFAINC